MAHLQEDPQNQQKKPPVSQPDNRPFNNRTTPADASIKIFLLQATGGIIVCTGLLMLFLGKQNIALVLLGAGWTLLALGLANYFQPLMKALAPLGLIVAGLGLLIVGINSLKNISPSSHWLPAPGSITCSEIENRTSMEADQNPGLESSIVEVAKIEYTYIVQDTSYTSHQINLERPKQEQAADLIERYPIHKRITAYYNPETPSEAVLEPGTSERNYLALFFGAVLILVGMVMTLKGISRL